MIPLKKTELQTSINTSVDFGQKFKKTELSDVQQNKWIECRILRRYATRNVSGLSSLDIERNLIRFWSK